MEISSKLYSRTLTLLSTLWSLLPFIEYNMRSDARALSPRFKSKKYEIGCETENTEEITDEQVAAFYNGDGSYW
jgi:hypothetical protein